MASSEFRNGIAFSVARETMLEDCERRYYYHVYLSWMGWWFGGKAPDPRRAEAYAAKALATEPQLVGTIIHRLIADEIGRSVDVAGLDERLVSLADWEISLAIARSDVTASASSPKNPRLLHPLTDGGSWMRDRVRSRIAALVAGPGSWSGDRGDGNLFATALRAGMAGRVVHKEELVRFQVDGTWINVVHDLVVKSATDSQACTIVDWKTGKPSFRDLDQMQIYALWAFHHGWESVTTACVYLGAGHATSKWLTFEPKFSVASTAARVERFVESLRGKLVDGSLERNEPIESEFAPTIYPSRCTDCRFAVMCERDGTKP